MRKIPLLLVVLLLLAGSIQLQPSIATAQSLLLVNSSELKISSLNSAADETEADLAKFVELAFEEQITVSETQAFYEQLTAKQKETVSDLVATKAGIPVNKWRREKESHQKEIASQSKRTTSLSEVWRENIEAYTGWGRDEKNAFSYWIDPLCEKADPPELDDDWVFYYPMSYSMNPSGLRWSTPSSQVWLALWAAYGGKLNSYAYNWNEVQVCLGTTGVSAAGGAANVKNNLKLRPP